MPSVFSHLILDVGDMNRSLDFYHGLLNLPVRLEDNYEGVRLVYLQTGRTEILLVQQPKAESSPALDRSGGLVINFHVRNLPRIASDLAHHHVRVLRPLETEPFGERSILVADPDGYAVLLSEKIEALR